LLEAFLNGYKAGSPTDAKVYGISLTRSQIRRLFHEKHQRMLTRRQIGQVLERLGYRFRSISKKVATGHYKRRDEQFKIIFNLVGIMDLKTPIISIDCKKKEVLGTLYRSGKVATLGTQEAYDPDYAHWGKGKVIPHGI
jgi:hypothetical protein